jgi:5-hydroxyisourate hydrolase
MAKLSTHVLDTARGVAAAGIVIDLDRMDQGDRVRVTTAVTNADGRTDRPLLGGDRIEPGVYELSFHAGDYLRRAGVTLPDPPFLDVVVVRIGIADAGGDYHVPLLLSPYGYSTYRGT